MIAVTYSAVPFSMTIDKGKRVTDVRMICPFLRKRFINPRIRRPV